MKLGCGEVQFQGCVLDGGALAICLCHHKPAHVPNKDKIQVYLTASHVDQTADFSFVLDSYGHEDTLLVFGNPKTFETFQLLVTTLARTRGR